MNDQSNTATHAPTCHSIADLLPPAEIVDAAERLMCAHRRG